MKQADILPVEVPDAFNVSTAFLDRHLENGSGDRIAIYAGDQQITYRALLERASRAGNALRTLGVRPDERVFLLLPDTPELAYLFWGAIRIGAVAVPTNTGLRAQDYANMLRDSQATTLVISQDLVPVVERVLPEARCLRHIVVAGERGAGALVLQDLLDAAEPALEPAATHRDQPAFWLWSSGSTGAPKGAVHLHHDMVFAAELYARRILGISECDVCLSVAKLFFAYGLGNGLYFPMHVGAATVLDPRRFDPGTTFDLICRYRPTLFFGVPTAYAAMLESDKPAELTGVRLCVSAGEPLPAVIWKRWVARFGVEILDGIGSTEALHIYISNQPGRVRPGSSGEVVPGYTVQIVDEDGGAAGTGEIGDLLVRGDSIAAFYWNQHERTKQVFLGEWFRTGDKYYRDEDGYYWYCGRSDDMLKVGGQWVSPAEVEAALIEHPAVLEAAVVGSPDHDQLVKPFAFVVLRRTHVPSPELERELQGFVRDRIAPFKYPRWVAFVPELPKTATGKIQRFRLRERLARTAALVS
ncbi:MAG TPA: benzoate-CoA ligase family protein [bacterium]|nr:benzoate-CoA ligase family protein [bacterium]